MSLKTGQLITDQPSLIERLRPAAEQVVRNVYAPYSGVQVGAAVLGDDGEIFAGCNVENASYGLSQCAERNALQHAVAMGASPGRLHALLVYSPGQQALPPCGACRQVMQEFMPEDAVIISCCDTADVLIWTLAELLPTPFTLDV